MHTINNVLTLYTVHVTYTIRRNINIPLETV